MSEKTRKKTPIKKNKRKTPRSSSKKQRKSKTTTTTTKTINRPQSTKFKTSPQLSNSTKKKKKTKKNKNNGNYQQPPTSTSTSKPLLFNNSERISRNSNRNSRSRSSNRRRRKKPSSSSSSSSSFLGSSSKNNDLYSSILDQKSATGIGLGYLEEEDDSMESKLAEMKILKKRLYDVTVEVNLLREKNEFLMREKEELLYRIDQNREDHERKVGQYLDSLESIKNGRKGMEEKLERVDEIEERIIQLYLEISGLIEKEEGKGAKIRSINEKMKLENERAALYKQNSLIVLNKVQHKLRSLFEWKEAFENELREGKKRIKSETEKELDRIKVRMRELQGERDEYRSNAARAIQEKNEAIHSRKMTIEESSYVLKKLQKDNESLLDELKQSRDTITSLNSTISARDKIVRHREIQLMKITQLESQLEKTKLKHKYSQKKIKNEQDLLMKKFEEQLKNFNKLKAEREDLKSELNMAKGKIHSLMKDNSRVKVMDLLKNRERNERKIENLDMKIMAMKEENRDLSRKVGSLKSKNEVLERNNKKILKDNSELISLAKNKKEKRIEDQAKILADTPNPKKDPVVNYFRKRLKEKELVVEKLRKKISAMILNENRKRISEKKKTRFIERFYDNTDDNTDDGKNKDSLRNKEKEVESLSKREQLKYFEEKVERLRGELKDLNEEETKVKRKIKLKDVNKDINLKSQIKKERRIRNNKKIENKSYRTIKKPLLKTK